MGPPCPRAPLPRVRRPARGGGAEELDTGFTCSEQALVLREPKNGATNTAAAKSRCLDGERTASTRGCWMTRATVTVLPSPAWRRQENKLVLSPHGNKPRLQGSCWVRTFRTTPPALTPRPLLLSSREHYIPAGPPTRSLGAPSSHVRRCWGAFCSSYLRGHTKPIFRSRVCTFRVQYPAPLTLL